jgi:hypothetical protein
MPTNGRKEAVMKAVYIRRRIMVVLLPILLGWGLIELSSEEPIRCSVTSVTAAPGDTLWGLAEEYCTPRHLTGEVVSDMVDLNKSADVRVGQIVWFP